MKIVFIVENYYPHIGGVEVVFKNLAEGLASKGHNVTVITHRLKNSKKTEELNGVKIHRINCFQSRYIFSFAAILPALKLCRDADIIHTTTFNGAFPAWMVSRLLRKPAIITVHEVWLGKWKEFTTMGTIEAGIHHFLERLIYMLSFDKYVGVSQSTRKQLLRIGKKPEKTAYVYNALDYRLFDPRRHSGKQIRKKHEMDNSFLCLSLGRPGPSKGLEYAVKAASLVNIPRLKYMLILSKDRQYKPRYKKLKALIQKLHLQKNFIFVEPVGHGQLPKYIRAADCVVMPSLSEGFGYVAAEAAALGVPVVASNTTSLPEVVSGKYLLVSPRSSEEIATAIERVYKKKYNKTPLKKFRLDSNINGYLKIYKELQKA